MRRPGAVVDVGTNTVRLLVPGSEVRETAITRLGQGVDAAGRLAPAPIARTADAVAAFVARAREAGAGSILIAGTSALRDAANSGEFAQAVLERCGEQVTVLSGPQEARAAWRGAGSRGTVLDIGGGSTELVTADAAYSMDVGSVRLRERGLSSEESDLLVRRWMSGSPLELEEPLVGVAGTITTLAMAVSGVRRWRPGCVHGMVLDASTVASQRRRLQSMEVAEILALPGMEPGRADVFASGVLICDVVMRELGAGEIVVSETDILDGLAAGL